MEPRTSVPAAGGIAVACAAQFLVGADGLSVAIALPTLQRELHAAPIDAQWVLTAYGLAFGGCLLLGGRLGDLYGRRRMLVAGMAVFAAGSLLAGLAGGLPTLVAARAVQGLGAATSVPAALALIGALVPAGPQRTHALSRLAAAASGGVLGGLLIGGIVVEALGWRAVFLVMAPLAGAAALAAPRVLPESRAGGRAAPDVPGAVLVTAGAMALLLGVTRLPGEGLAAPLTLAPLATGVALLAAFVAWERRAPAPLVPVAALRARSLRTATLTVGANAVSFTAIVYLGTLYLQSALGYGPLRAALALAPVDVVAGIVPVLAGSALGRQSPRRVLVVAFALTAAALLWLARAPVPANYVTDLLAPLVVLGVSLSVAFVVLVHEAVADVPDEDKGVASGIFETSNHLLGGAVGVAVYASVLAAGGYRAGFAVAAGFAALGLLAGRTARSGPHGAAGRHA